MRTLAAFFALQLLVSGAAVEEDPGLSSCQAGDADCGPDESALLGVRGAAVSKHERSLCSNPFVVQQGDTCTGLWSACSYGYIMCGSSGPFCCAGCDTNLPAGATCTNG
jgi:hypothetical protein